CCDRIRHRLPQLPRPEARVVKLGDEALDLVSLVAEERRLRGRGERQAFDPLRGPLRPDLGCRDAPDLLRVRLEEQLEETPAESVRDPIFERIVALVALRGCTHVRAQAARELDSAELADDV